MRRATLRLAAAGALGAAILSTLGVAAAEEPGGALRSAVGVQPGQPVTVGAAVPTVARTRIGGAPVTRRVARPTRLEKLTQRGWTTAASRTAPATGRVVYSFSAPAATTRYRVVAPAHRVTLKRRVGGQARIKRVQLRAWTGPARIIGVDASPAPDTHDLSLLTPRANDPNPYLREASIDERGDAVAFVSMASDLVPDDDNGQIDVFVVDTRTGVVELVSRNLDGKSANNASIYADISPDGRFVTFTSQATDLVPGPQNSLQQVYLYDRVTHQTERVSAYQGVPGDGHSRLSSVSRNGEHVAFETDAINLTTERPELPQVFHVLRYTRGASGFHMATLPEDRVYGGNSHDVSLSDDGSRVAFQSENDHLVSDDHNGLSDVFLYDFRTSLRKMISRQPDGDGLDAPSVSPLISGSGNAVLWQTRARTVVPLDDNDGDDAFRYDVATRRNVLLSVRPDGHSLDGHSGPVAVDADGSHALLWSSWERPGSSLYVRDVLAGTLRPLGGGSGAVYDSRDAAMDGDGDRVAFATYARLTPDDVADGGDIYLWAPR